MNQVTEKPEYSQGHAGAGIREENNPSILVIAVIYNTYPEALRYLESFAAERTPETLMILVDNSDRPAPGKFTKALAGWPFVEYLATGNNPGYFGGARAGLSLWHSHHRKQPRWTLVTNVDIIFRTGFFRTLSTMEPGAATGMVAPSILSLRWKSDLNPQRMEPYTRKHLLFLSRLYRFPLLHNLYIAASYLKKLIRGLRSGSGPAARREAGVIYAPHGSCLIFSRHFFDRGGSLGLPQFLFGEEIVLAETARRLGLVIEYRPELAVDDHEHASTGLFVNRKMNRYYRESVLSILRHYYPEQTGGQI